MVGIQSKIQLLFLTCGERNFLRYFRDTVPNVLNQQNAFRNTKTENVLAIELIMHLVQFFFGLLCL